MAHSHRFAQKTSFILSSRVWSWAQRFTSILPSLSLSLSQTHGFGVVLLRFVAYHPWLQAHTPCQASMDLAGVVIESTENPSLFSNITRISAIFTESKMRTGWLNKMTWTSKFNSASWQLAFKKAAVVLLVPRNL